MAFAPDRLDRRDPAFVAALLPAFEAFNRHWIRLRVDGLAHLPRGRALLVGNLNGGILGPGLFATLGTLWRALGPEAPLYALAHDFAMRQLTPLGRLLQRCGAVRACPANAVRVLRRGGLALVYPGGDLEAYRHARRRDEIVLGPRTGFVRVAQRTGVPIVPVVAHGAHRSAWVLTEGAAIARALRLPRWGRLARFPVAVALPWGIAAGPWVPWLPLPFPVRLRILPPLAVAPDEPPADARERVRRAMQAALDALAAEAV
jgi:1-acyl-sn-glycerol-3-phosphate acyltransferase